MKSFSINYEKKEDIENLLKNLDLEKNILVQVFSGVIDEKIIKNIQKSFAPYENITLIGTTTDGEINNKVSTHKIVIVASEFEKTSLKSHFVENRKEKELGREISKNIVEENSKVIITFATGLNINAEEYLNSLCSKQDIIISGGLAGDNGEFKKTYVFDKKSITSFGAVAVSLNGEDLIANRNYALNWIGITKELTITKADKNRVDLINGKSAVEIYRKYLGDIVANRLPATGIEFPLLIEKGDITIARAVIGREGESLIFAGNLEQGEKVKIGYGNVSDILHKDNDILNKINNSSIETIFIYSCMARRRFLGKNIDIEIAPFSTIAPTFGFFTYGEFYNREFLNESMTVLTLSENNIKNSRKFSSIDVIFNEQIVTLSALTHLIKTTLQELNSLNKNLTNLVREKTKKILRKNKELEYQFYHDFLTHLPNKHLFDKENENFNVAVLVDIVKFSSINELYGEEFGDQVLLKVSSYLRSLVKTQNIHLYKINADQFIFLSQEDYFIEKLIKSQDIEVENIKVRIDFKIAKSKYKPFKTTTELALKKIKNSSEEFIEYSKELKLEEEIERDIRIVKKVANAIKEDRIIPYFQKIEKRDGISYECLVRLQKEDRILSPNAFKEVIETTPYYFEITKIMIEKSCKYFSDKPFQFSLNFAYKDIQSKEIIEYLFEKVEKYNVQDKIIVEILESESIKDYEKAKEFIQKIKNSGMQLAIDDFGSGYSNFIILQELEPDYLKIDGSLIKNILKDKRAWEIVKAITSLAKKMNIKVIAEFVENEEIKRKLEELDVDGYQGYFIEAPKETIF